MTTTFDRLSVDWNAEPNSPEPSIEVSGDELKLAFRLNAFVFPRFNEGDAATLIFTGCWRYRLGRTNDEGWYRGQCRFSRLAPQWGEFFEVCGDLLLSKAPNDWVVIGPEPGPSRHFLFYFRDETFECDAQEWRLHLPDGPATQVA